MSVPTNGFPFSNTTSLPSLQFSQQSVPPPPAPSSATAQNPLMYSAPVSIPGLSGPAGNYTFASSTNESLQRASTPVTSSTTTTTSTSTSGWKNKASYFFKKNILQIILFLLITFVLTDILYRWNPSFVQKKLSSHSKDSLFYMEVGDGMDSQQPQKPVPSLWRCLLISIILSMIIAFLVGKLILRYQAQCNQNGAGKKN